MRTQCECSDPGCKVHKGAGCRAVASTTLYRVDMHDSGGVRFCEACADDAFDSGVFTSQSDVERQEEWDYSEHQS